MKILLLSSSNSIHTVRWANGIAENGHNVVVVSLEKDANKNFHKNVELVNLTFPRPFGYYLNVIELNRIINKQNPDIINAHYASGYGTLLRMTNTKYPSLLSIWGSDVFDFPFQSKRKFAVIKKNLSFPNALSSTSGVMKDHTEKEFGVYIPYVTPFGVDLNIFGFQKKIHHNKFTFGIIKTLEDRYGIDILLLAFNDLISRLPEEDIYLDIYGNGSQRTNLETLSSKLGLEKRVTFHGKIDHSLVPKTLNELDVFIAPSRQESFGVAIIEAGACGVPVIASEALGFKEILKNNETGILFPIDDYKQLSISMEELYFDEAKRNYLSQNFYEVIKESYDWDKNVKKMISDYEEIVEKADE